MSKERGNKSRKTRELIKIEMNTYSSWEWISEWKLRNWIHTVVGNENKWVCVWLCTRIVCYLPQGNKCHNKSWWGKYAIIWLIYSEGILQAKPSTPLLTSWDRVTRFLSPNCWYITNAFYAKIPYFSTFSNFVVIAEIHCSGSM